MDIFEILSIRIVELKVIFVVDRVSNIYFVYEFSILVHVDDLIYDFNQIGTFLPLNRAVVYL